MCTLGCRASEDEQRHDKKNLNDDQLEVFNRQKEERITEAVNNAMSQDTDAVIGCVCDSDDVWDVLMEVCVTDCDIDFDKLSVSEVMYLARSAYKLNRTIATDMRRFVDARD